MPLHREAVPADYQRLKLIIKGLKGSHSGADIHLGLGNANKLMTRFLFAHAKELSLRVLDLNGGTLRNAIHREAFGVVAVPADKTDALTTLSQKYLATLHNELSAKEQNITLLLKRIASASLAMSADSQQRLLALLNGMLNGVIRMSDAAVKGGVETSLNLGMVITGEIEAEIICLIRSLIDSGKDDLVNMLSALGQLSGAKVVSQSRYPG